MTMPTLPLPVTDTDLDTPDIRAAARAVVDDLASGDLAPTSLHEPDARRRPRIAVAAAVAAVVLGAGAAGYALTAGPGGDRHDQVRRHVPGTGRGGAGRGRAGRGGGGGAGRDEAGP